MLRLQEDSKEKIMILRLLPEQVSKFWDVIKYAVEESLPPIVGDHPDKINRILSSALSGKIEVWASYTKNEGALTLGGIALTKMLYDDASDTRNLLIYCIYGYGDISNDIWIKGFETLAKYAKSRKCLQMIAYSNLPNIISLAKRLGGETDYTFISFDLNKTV